MATPEFASLDDVRARIDQVDRDVVRLLVERAGYVGQAVRFKRSADEARAPARVDQVIARVRDLAAEDEANPDVVEHVYCAMIACFVDAELRALGHGDRRRGAAESVPETASASAPASVAPSPRPVAEGDGEWR